MRIHLNPTGPVLFGPEPGIGFSQYICWRVSAVGGAKVVRWDLEFHTAFSGICEKSYNRYNRPVGFGIEPGIGFRHYIFGHCRSAVERRYKGV